MNRRSDRAREVFEETGLTVATLTFFGTFSDPTRLVEYVDGTAVAPANHPGPIGPRVASAIPLVISSESTALRYVPNRRSAVAGDRPHPSTNRRSLPGGPPQFRPTPCCSRTSSSLSPLHPQMERGLGVRRSKPSLRTVPPQLGRR